jgi:pimeloyl-ACP methyl ester carboxylesterase
VRIHYLERGTPEPGRPSLLVAPGVWESAERALPILEAAGGHAAAVSFRGRGKSDTPRSGYDLEPHVEDLDAVARATRMERVCPLGFSRGVGYVLAWALEHPERVAGLILVDARARHSRPREDFAESWERAVFRGRPIRDFIRLEALRGLQAEAREVLFWDRLPELRVPVLLMQGTSRTVPPPSNLPDEGVERYRAAWPDLRLLRFERSGHMLLDEEPEKYLAAVRDFLADLRGGELSGRASENGRRTGGTDGV